MGGVCCCCCLGNADKKNTKNQKYQKRGVIETGRVFKRVERAIIGVDREGHTCVNEYRILSELSSNTHGKVCICEDRELKSLYAVKISPKVGSMSNNEVNNLKNLEHPNLIRLIEVIDDPQVSERYLILEFLEGGSIMTVNEHGQADGPVHDEDAAQKYMTQLVAALDYLHGLNIVHGNIKPENILLTRDRQTCKLSDFQMSTAGLEHDMKKIRISKERRDEVPWFRAPEELMAGEVVAGRACDLWALGATLYVMVFGVVPFRGCNGQEVADNVTSQALSFPDAPISRMLRMLLRRMLEKDLLIRITLNEILDDPWVTGETSWQGRSRERATDKPAKAPKSQFALLKEKASKRKVERIPGRHLLVAEDVYLVRELVVRMLKGILVQNEEEIHVDSVVDGDEAVEAMEKKSYTLIFMDLHMSRMSGFDATLQIRDFENANGLEPCIIIGLTGDLHEEISEVCLKVGMNEVATKPLRPNQARALAERYGFPVNWEKTLDPRSLTSDGKPNVFLKSYCRYLENHGEALPMSEGTATRAALSFLLLHTRKQLPFHEDVESGQACLKAIVGFIGYHGLDDDGQSEISEAEEQLPLAPILQRQSMSETQICQAISLGELKTAITKKAESVRTGIDNCGNRYINEYTLLDQLGVGAYGTVYQVVNTYNEQIYALKSANKRQLTKSVGSFRIEVEILQSLNHPNIIKVFEIIDDPNSQEVYFVIEFVEGGSVATVDSVGGLDKRIAEVEAKKLMAQCIAGLEYLHGHNVVHRDIKPDNILLDRITGTYKLSDFGVSHFLASDADDALKNLSGTPLFAAPETCKGCGESYSGKAADIWALGVTLYGLIYGQVPFKVQSQYQLFKDIQTKEITFPERPRISAELRMLLNRMLEKDVLLRITGPEVRDHSWVTGKENLIRKVSKEVRDTKKKRVLAPQPRPLSDLSGPHHVLIVEDVFLVRELLRKMFNYVLDVPKDEEDRFGIDCVADGDEAIEAYALKRYQLVLMDVHMPKVSGFDATLRIREMEMDKGLPRAAIVGQTGDVHERINEVCMDVGMDEVVQKPLTPSVLRNICVRYGFPVKKHAPLPKDLFDKGHAFTSSFKQYVERCDPGTLQPNKVPSSSSAIKLDRMAPHLHGSLGQKAAQLKSPELQMSDPARLATPQSLHVSFLDPVLEEAAGPLRQGTGEAAPVRAGGMSPRFSLLAMGPSTSDTNLHHVQLEGLAVFGGPDEPDSPAPVLEAEALAHAVTDDLTVSPMTVSEQSPQGPLRSAVQPSFLQPFIPRPLPTSSDADRAMAPAIPADHSDAVSDVVSDMQSDAEDPPTGPEDAPIHLSLQAASPSPGGSPGAPHISPDHVEGDVRPTPSDFPDSATDTPLATVPEDHSPDPLPPGNGTHETYNPKALHQPGPAEPNVPRTVDPRAYIGAMKKTSKMKLLLAEEVLPVIQTLLIGEVQKRHETVSQFLAEEEIRWVREETEKVFAQAEGDPQLHTHEGVDETQLRKMVHSVLPTLVSGLDTAELPRTLCSAYAAQECGKRDAQEDAFVCLNKVAQLFSWPQTGTALDLRATKELTCCAVYDGHGGRTASEYCRNQFHMFVLRALQGRATLQEALPQAMLQCNAVYNVKAEKANSNAGTTASVLFIEEDAAGTCTLVTANLGDCRIVLCSNGEAVDLTRDHKPSDEGERRRIEALGGEVVFNSGAWRVNGVLTVSRALGSVRSCQKFLSCVPDIATHQITPADQFAIIASDGLWNVMSSAEVVQFVLEAKAEIDGVAEGEEGEEKLDGEAEEDAEGMSYQLIAEGLVGHAIDNLKSDDNVTVILIFFDHHYQDPL
eukprot:GGOE01001367.1.p1 GENE.GGOE01001367.1~~GGOE01001367.1.p1  ORF type:complete len:1825 (+),score=558.82 GGOE01001367.1:29-5476(+)